MRILIKGGVWRNTEDEILKAAVMKYGLNQWARISSLLVRKSAKQCKARWYEWLDPAIKKTEWTREEDEKLLHLAKLMPTQWRTIAPIVGRTPAQCLERYEKLLDMAAGKEGKYDPTDDPRRLRPGEIDPNPESKPARPDPIDMDEDEKEMLSEARARLANTRGKKAKRKAREKALEEARRLAVLQKKRELKAAGIEMREKRWKTRGIDYSKEVAFEKKPAAGFYDIQEEAAATKAMKEEFRPVTKEELEGKKRQDIEAGLMKQDLQRQKMLERKNVPAAVAKAVEMNEATLQRRRGKMMLPAPQISDAELEALARQGGELGLDPELAEGGSEATRALLGDYATPARFATPMRTPARTPQIGGQERLMREAQNLVQLQMGKTPLLGGENPDLHPSDFSGVTPRPLAAATPNPLAAAATPGAGRSVAGVAATPGLLGATPGHGGRAVAGIAATPGMLGATPGRGGLGPGATPTPMRDALGLNDPDSFAAATKREEAARVALMRNELRAGLSQLPAPKNEYQIVVPELPEDEVPADFFEEDAADVERRRKAAAEAARAAELKKRSKVLQRALPRPATLELLPEPRPDEALGRLSARELAEEMLHREMNSLLSFEAAKYPLREAKKAKKGAVQEPAVAPIDQFEEAEMAAAAELLGQEVAFVRGAMNHGELAETDYMAAWESVARDIIYVPAQQRYTRAASATNADRVASVQAEFEGVRKDMEREAKRAAKLEQKAGVLTAGLAGRGDKLRGEAEEAWEALQSAGVELECFRALHEQEQRAGPERIEALQELVRAQQEKEAALQERYKELVHQRTDLFKAMQQRGLEVR